VLAALQQSTRLPGAPCGPAAAGAAVQSAAARAALACALPVQAPTGQGTKGELPVANETLVIVDDEPDAVEALKILLELDGYTVHAATTAEAALALVAVHLPTAVILDLGMPVIDGLTLARRLRELHGPDLPLVAITGWSDVDEREKAEAAGVDLVLVKPVEPRALRALFPPTSPGG
jgi:CheY-like chemotaxis protein